MGRTRLCSGPVFCTPSCHPLPLSICCFPPFSQAPAPVPSCPPCLPCPSNPNSPSPLGPSPSTATACAPVPWPCPCSCLRCAVSGASAWNTSALLEMNSPPVKRQPNTQDDSSGTEEGLRPGPGGGEGRSAALKLVMVALLAAAAAPRDVLDGDGVSACSVAQGERGCMHHRLRACRCVVHQSYEKAGRTALSVRAH